MEPSLPPPGAARSRRVAVVLAAAALVCAVGGALWATRFVAQLRRDPGLVYRDRGTLDSALRRAGAAERAGDHATAITLYRFVAAVARGGGPELAPYLGAARAALTRLGAPDTLPGPPR
ncbi:MAG TPA: hypothetical protein VH158_03165 [Gemmatimonadales bacterium]|nr:hypothetical protein [Gemmatimonadales bacterium]